MMSDFLCQSRRDPTGVELCRASTRERVERDGRSTRSLIRNRFRRSRRSRSFSGSVGIGSLQPGDDAFRHRFRPSRLDVAFPGRPDMPPGISKVMEVTLISRLVGCELRLPELRPCRGGSRETAALMTMPEAAMHEDHRAMPGHDDVRATRKSSIVQPEPQSSGVQCLPQRDLRFRVLPADAGHHARTGCLVDDVSHDLAPGETCRSWYHELSRSGLQAHELQIQGG